MTWGLAGPYVSDMIGEKLGLKANEAEIEKIKPKISVVDREDLKK